MNDDVFKSFETKSGTADCIIFESIASSENYYSTAGALDLDKGGIISVRMLSKKNSDRAVNEMKISEFGLGNSSKVDITFKSFTPKDHNTPY